MGRESVGALYEDAMAVAYWRQRKLARPVRIYLQNRKDIRRLAGLTERPLRLVIGASGKSSPGWHTTEQRYLDLLKPAHWERFFAPGGIDAMFAEHVWEHLTPEEALAAARTCHRFLAAGGSLRVAVPDGFHPNSEYIAAVRPGGTGGGADDHQVLYDHVSLRGVFEAAGFGVELLEYFDENGVFHGTNWSDERGHVRRSARYDERNAGGTLTYTSIILDAVK